MTPAEIINQRAAGIITTEQMMDKLLSWTYTFGSVVCVDGVVTDAYMAGDWDAVTTAYYLKKISDDEFERLAHYAQHQESAVRSHNFDGSAQQSDDSERKQIADYIRRLTKTAFTTEEVAAGLGITQSQIRHMRLARELWAIPDGPSWRFPAAQFDIDATTCQPTRQVPGLAQVLATLPAGLHPIAVDGFLHTTQPDLYRDRAQTPLEWLRSGGEVSAAVTAALVANWYGR